MLRDSILLSLRDQFSSSSGFVTPDELIHRNPPNHKDTNHSIMKEIKFTPVVIKELVLMVSAMVGEGHPGSF